MDISLTKLPWYAQIGAFVVLAGIGVGVFYMYYEQPARADLAARTTQLAALEGRHRQGIRDGTAAAAIPNRRSPICRARLETLKSVLPEEKDAADLLRRLQTVATQSNLTIKAFKPAPTVMKQLHAEWPIALELDGTYHNLAVFFDRVGKFTRIVNVSALDIKGKDKPDPSSTITATCVATTFVLLDKPNLPKKAGQPAGRGV